MITQKLFGLLPLLTLVAAAPAALQPRDDAPSDKVKVGGVLPEAIMADVQSMFDYFGTTGAVIAIVSPDDFVNGVEVFGIKDVEGNNMTADTFHSIGSNSKFVTTLALSTMQAWDNLTLSNGEKFTVDSRWKDIYPDFAMVDPNGTEQATVANFMMMNTGVSTVNQAIALDDTAESTLKKFAELKPTVPFPANSSQYSTIHFNAVAGVTQWVANQTLEDFLNAHIWGPAGMEAKMNALDAKATGRRGQAFSIEWDSSVACFIDLSKDVKYNESAACAGNATVFDYWSNGTTLEQQGGGSVLMTGEDMYKWSQLAIGKTAVLPEGALEIAYGDEHSIPIAGIDNANLTYGLGVNKQITATGQMLMEHGGAVYGHNSAFFRDLDKQTAVFVLINEDRFGFLLADAVANHVIKSLTGTAAEGEAALLIDIVISKTTGVPTGLYKKQLEDEAAAAGGEGGSGESAADGQAEDPSGGAGVPGGLTLPPETPRPIPDNITIEGTYTAPGYPELILAPINLTDITALDAAGLSVALLAEAADIGVNATRPAYLGDWNGSFTNYVLLTHFDGPAFNYTLILTVDKLGELGPDGNKLDWEAQPGDIKANKIYGIGPAVFGPGTEGQAGLGFFGGIVGQPGTILKDPVYAEDEVESTAGVFYTRQ